ncbi:MAG: hypothetical protein PVH24_04225 [Candidatus Zixiibacteriota bacterium]|jgi:hypothetical protein
MATRKTRSRRRRVTTRPATTRRRTAKAGSPWTREEIAFLRKNYRKNETKWVARQLGRTVYSVRYKASDLNIRKANPSVWKGNKGNMKKTARPTTTRRTKAANRRRTTKTRWARTSRRITRKARSRRTSRSKRR